MAYPGDVRSVLAAVDSAVLRCLGERQVSGQVADVYERIPAWMRPSLGLQAGEGLKRLLGRWDKHGAFQPAQVAPEWRLTEEEAAVYWWDIRGWEFREVQRELTPKGLRFDPGLWRDAEEVHGLLESARGKVRGMFGVGA